MNEENGRSSVGIISLVCSMLGIVLPIVLGFLAYRFGGQVVWPYFLLCILLFIGLELIALITGIIGRKSPAGKAGMIVSIVCATLTLLAIILVIPLFWLFWRIEPAPVMPAPPVIEQSHTVPAPAPS
ncbi:MAG: hypothetical protein NTY53_13755, partial [Kiritimatiellaeota bacterium]|nr:hypothetical protein [Kiritimatiellota bacterium]